MSAPPLAGTEYACVRAILEHPIAEVWSVAGQFGGLETWADGVTACAVDGAGVGAVRSVTRGGVVCEQLVARDARRHHLSYRILPPHALPADDVVSAITLRRLGPRATEVVWRSAARRFSAPMGPLGARIEAFYRASIESLDRRLHDPGATEAETA